jgi:acyl-CoA synthetase (AMP-forming)/AMP-acid ligase II
VLSSDRPDPPTADDLHSALQGRLAGYKVPKQVVVVDEVHRSPTGKADYRWALATATAGSVGDVASTAPDGNAAGASSP